MIIKRVTKALRRQDWASVTIEFILVVVGVLLGFQINEWASERDAQAERHAAMERLLDESENGIAYFKHGVREHEETVHDLSYALGSLQNGTWRTADKARMMSGLTEALYLDSPSPPSSVYDDIVATGMLGKIGDSGLRAAISRHRAKLALLSKLVDYIRLTVPRFDGETSLYYVYEPDGPRPARLEADFASLASDRKLKSSLALLNDRQWFILQTWKQTLLSAKTMCRELARTLQKPCDEQRAVKRSVAIGGQ